MHFNKKLLDILNPYKRDFGFSILLGLTAGILSALQAYLLSIIINLVFLNNHALNDIIHYLVILLAITLVKSVIQWGEKYYSNNTSSSIKADLRKKLQTKFFDLGPIYFKSVKTGDYTNTIISGVDKIDTYFSQFLPQLFLSILIPVTFLIMVFPIDLLSGIVFLITAPLIIIFMILIGSYAETKSKEKWRTLGLMSGYFLDVLQGLQTIKNFGRSSHVLEKIKIVSQNFKESTLKILRIAFLSALVLELFSTISIAIIAVEIGIRLLYGDITFQPALFLLILAPEFYNPIRQLGARYHAGIEGISAAESIIQILSEPELNLNGSINLMGNVGSIKFTNVSFSYDDKKILNDISFTISEGSQTAIIGESGAGKTTITNLLMKFIKPNKGNILISNTDLNSLSRNEWLNNVSWVNQNPYLFHSTIEENILIAKPNASRKELEISLEQAKIIDFIRTLPKGIKTNIGERGTRLSGGEAQRIALARAFLKNSPLLIIDEPTVNLDPQTEYKIIESINELVKNKTVLIVAHRLNTIESSDNIIVVENGEIIEQGNHNELLNMKGYYKRMRTQKDKLYA